MRGDSRRSCGSGYNLVSGPLWTLTAGNQRNENRRFWKDRAKRLKGYQVRPTFQNQTGRYRTRQVQRSLAEGRKQRLHTAAIQPFESSYRVYKVIHKRACTHRSQIQLHSRALVPVRIDIPLYGRHTYPEDCLAALKPCSPPERNYKFDSQSKSKVAEFSVCPVTGQPEGGFA